jgi:EAL domain-containing protein (putative c-di-GMP-specific phosphodiesterase class I)
MVASLVTMVRDMGVSALAEGVETEEERDICVGMGFELGQGFYFGRPVSLRRSSMSNCPVEE